MNIFRRHNRPTRYWLVGYAVVTGGLLYVPFHMILDKSYLIPGDRYLKGDVAIFISLLLLLSVAIWGWWAVYKQFIKDKTLLGFSKDKSGVMLIFEIIIEVGITFFTIYLQSSGF